MKFDWDNDNLDEIELSKTDEKLVQPEFIAEVPGIEVQGDYDMIIRPKPDAGLDKEMLSVAQHMTEASENAGRNLEANTQVKARGVDIGSSDGSVIDLRGDNDEPDGGVYHVKQELVIIKEASDDEEGDDAPSLVYGSDSDSSDNEDDNPSPTGRGHRVRVATKNYTPSHNNKTYGESHVETSMDSPPAVKSRKTGTSPRGNNRVPVVSPRCGNISRRALNQFVINAYLNQQQAQGMRGGLDYLLPLPSHEN